MSCLVLGSRGFVGSRLISHLVKAGQPFHGADIGGRSTTHYTAIDESNPNYRALLKEQNPTWIVNCAGAASVPQSLANPTKDFSLNTVLVFQLLEAVRGVAPDAKFINLSSAAVYGNPGSLPVRVDSPIEPVSPYGFHKRMSEMICKEFATLFSLKTVSLRVFSAFGNGLKKQLFWDLHQKFKSGDLPITLFGTGKESRDFIFIDDLVRSIELIGRSSCFDGGCINVGSGRETSIKEAVDVFYSFYDRKPDYRFSDQARAGDPTNWLADIRPLEALGFRPRWTLREGLHSYHQWLQQQD